MNKMNLIAGLLLAVSAAGANAAGTIDSLTDVPTTRVVLDFENEDGHIFGAGQNYGFGGASLVADQQITVGQNAFDLGENGLWGGNGNHFLSFDNVGAMTLNLSFNGQTTRGFAFDYSLYETNPQGGAQISVVYYDSADNFIGGHGVSFSPAFGIDSYNQFGTTGYVSDSANIARISISGDGVVLDNLTFTQAVPEPESYAMLLAGLGVLVAVARRRQQGV